MFECKICLTIISAEFESKSLFERSIIIKDLPSLIPFMIGLNYSFEIEVEERFRNYIDVLNLKSYSSSFAPFIPILFLFNPSLFETSSEIKVQF